MYFKIILLLAETDCNMKPIKQPEWKKILQLTGTEADSIGNHTLKDP